ncbi:hypothetical protein [Kocuria sp. CNJ-770]|uniref:hypothetical protein n=1 Tax=Kocuria sp. CNJ-770 TaxID=1904964 RepID=UPI001300EAD4|nr:hypothetical protein [Kocuria sp. CNJ-770]
MNILNDHVDVNFGSIPISTKDLALIDAAAEARGANREAMVRLLFRNAIRSLREVTR